MNARTKAILGTVGTVIVLAGVIYGLSAISAPRKQQTPPTIQLSAAQKSQAEYSKGLAALASGDTSAAVAAFRTAIALDANNTAAKAKLEEVTKSTTTKKPSTSKTSTTTPPAADPFATKVADIKKLLPPTYPNFVVGTATSDGRNAEVPATPSHGGSPISHVLWSVHEQSTTAKASEFIKDVSKSLYPKNAADTTINGVPAYFGTDGTRFAVVAYRRGLYVFEVVLTSGTGSPASLKADAEAAAAAFATKP